MILILFGRLTGSSAGRHLVFMLALCCSVVQASAQAGDHSFLLSGKINVDSGRISFIPVGDSSYYPAGFFPAEKEISRGLFVFTGRIFYPLAFQLLLKADSEHSYLSDLFFVQPGQQTILCNVDSMRETPLVSNELMKAYRTTWLMPYNAIESHVNDYEARVAERKKLVYAYSRANPDSYISLWEIIVELKRQYAPMLDSAYNELSGKLKYSSAGLLLKKQLKGAAMLDIGKTFPPLLLQDIQGNKKNFAIHPGKYKYSFIDFWFSQCTPCLRQFPKYKTLYARFRDRGLGIIGISVDEGKNITDWKRIVRNSPLDWPQYLDEDGRLSSNLGIARFPTNFLLDEHGKIIARDLSPEDLDNFLNKHL